MRRPDFFIVGAPKSGTTFLHDRLREHPRIFLPWMKEPHYFGQDLRITRGRISQDEYLELFRDAADDQIVGEASVWYLVSKRAASEIKSFSPQSRIIIMLRNPVEMVRSLHQYLLYIASEDIPGLREAIEAEADRRRGRRIPERARNETALLYLEAATYSPQVKRYLDEFGPENVHVVLHDDLLKRSQGVYDATLEFLGVNPGYQISAERVNERREARSSAIQTLLHRPPAAVTRAARVLLPSRQRARLVTFIQRFNTRKPAKSELKAETRRWLGAKLEDDVRELAQVIGRDLSGWIRSWNI